MTTDTKEAVRCPIPAADMTRRRWFHFWKPLATIIPRPKQQVENADPAAPISWEEAQGGYGW